MIGNCVYIDKHIDGDQPHAIHSRTGSRRAGSCAIWQLEGQDLNASKSMGIGTSAALTLVTRAQNQPAHNPKLLPTQPKCCSWTFLSLPNSP